MYFFKVFKKFSLIYRHRIRHRDRHIPNNCNPPDQRFNTPAVLLFLNFVLTFTQFLQSLLSIKQFLRCRRKILKNKQRNRKYILLNFRSEEDSALSSWTDDEDPHQTSRLRKKFPRTPRPHDKEGDPVDDVDPQDAERQQVLRDLYHKDIENEKLKSRVKI